MSHLQTQKKNKLIPQGVPQQARRVSLPNQTTGKQITPEAKPIDPSATILWLIVGGKNNNKKTQNE